jgi:hypothetical protein
VTSLITSPAKAAAVLLLLLLLLLLLTTTIALPSFTSQRSSFISKL